MRLGQRAAEDREVLREDVHDSTVDPAEAGDDAIAHDPLVVRDELGRASQDEGIELGKGFPFACCWAIRCSPPPTAALARISERRSVVFTGR